MDAVNVEFFLSLLNSDLKNITHPNKINVIGMECQTKNALTIHSKEVEEQLLLGCLHAGIGHSHLDAV